jgi:hypothetical protein
MRAPSLFGVLALFACSNAVEPLPAGGLSSEPLPEIPVATSPKTCEHQIMITLDEDDLRQSTPDLVACRSEWVDASGCVAAHQRVELDEAGRVVREELRIVGDSSVLPQAYVEPTDYIATHRWDAHGNELESAFDELGDGTIDWTRQTTFDANDRPLERISTSEQGRTLETWRYDERGNVLEEHQESSDQSRTTRRTFSDRGQTSERVFEGERMVYETTIERDAGGQEIAKHTWWSMGRTEDEAWQRDGAGRPLVHRWTRIDPNAQPIIEETTISYGAKGHPAQSTLKSFISERQTRERRIRHDDEGHELMVEEDSDYDGSVDWFREQRFDGEGRMTFWRTVADGATLIHTESRFDADGKKVEQIEHPSRAYPEGFIHRTTYDTRGRVILQESFTLAEAARARVATFYDDTARARRTEIDQNADGKVDQIEHQKTDAADRTIWTASDQNADGLLDRTSSALFDRGGNLLYSARDDGADGPETQLLAEYGSCR